MEPLTAEEVKKHQEKYGPNELVEGKKKTTVQIFLEQFKDFLVIILIVAAIVSGFLGDAESAVVILIVITINAILGTVQTVKAEQSLNSLKTVSYTHLGVPHRLHRLERFFFADGPLIHIIQEHSPPERNLPLAADLPDFFQRLISHLCILPVNICHFHNTILLFKPSDRSLGQDVYKRQPYNIYNTLSAYAALNALEADRTHFQEMIETFDYGNNRESIFSINGARVQLHLAKNPIGFQQKISLVLKDKKPKDIIIQINDTYQDGEDISWLWDVDFQYLADAQAATITTTGTRRHDMGLRLKYEEDVYKRQPPSRAPNLGTSSLLPVG